MSDWLSLWNPTVESCPLYHPKERRSVYYWSNMSQGTIVLYSMIDISMFSKYEQTLHLTLTSYWIAHLHRSYWISHVLRFLHLQRTPTTLHRVFYQSQQTGHQPPVFTNNPVHGQGKLFPVSTRKFGLESWVRLSRLTSARSIFVPGLNRAKYYSYTRKSTPPFLLSVMVSTRTIMHHRANVDCVHCREITRSRSLVLKTARLTGAAYSGSLKYKLMCPPLFHHS